MCSIFCAIMDRTSILQKTLPTWLNTTVNEIILVDWGQYNIKQYIPKDNKIIIIEVPQKTKWNLSKSFNIGSQYTTKENILKLDVDVMLSSDFFEEHVLTDKIFYTGSWIKARNSNETHLNGIVYIKRNLFMKVNGYNENLNIYGYDDTDLYERLQSILDIKRLTLNLDKLYHIPHSDKKRLENIESNLNIKESIMYNQKICINKWKGPMITPKQIFYVEVVNGLGNRLRTLASAAVIAKSTNRKLIIIWIPSHHCEAKFNDLFDSEFEIIEDLKLFKFRPETISKRFYELPCELPSNELPCELPSNELPCELPSNELPCELPSNELPCELMKYTSSENSDSISIETFSENILNSHDIKVIFLEEYIRSAQIIKSPYTNWYKESEFIKSLKPTKEILDIISNFEKQHNIYQCIGVHIRMGQPGYSFESTKGWNDKLVNSLNYWRNASHWSKFYKRMNDINKIKNETYFLCSDNNIYDNFKDLRICYTIKHKYDRSIDQVKSGLIDIILLSKTKKLLGSNWSTFTELAAKLMYPKPIELSGIHF